VNELGQFASITRFADFVGSLDVATNTTYDDSSRLIDREHAQGTTVLTDYEWVSDENGQITSFTTVDGTGSSRQ
jgi:hypothetical protein